MPPRRDLRFCRAAYAALLRLYPARHRQRFGEGMAQTFNDLLRERLQAGRGCLGLALRLAFETMGSIMKENLDSARRDRRFVRPAVGTGLLLLVPAVMSVADRGKPPGDGWHWGPGDFVVMGLLLFVAGVAWELLSARVAGRVRKAAVGGAVVLVALAVWVELAVDGVSQLARMATG